MSTDRPAQSPESELLLREVALLATLAEVLAWGRAATGRAASPMVISDVIVQDEFTHDAIVPIRQDFVLVFGST